jgi:hypothetical protein
MKTLGHYWPQMKVTRPPGRDPAGWQSISFTEARRSQRPQWAASRFLQDGAMNCGTREARWGG